MRPFLVAISLTLSASIALAQTSIEQPVSSPIYGPAAGDQIAPVVASNGSDFFAAWFDGRGSLSTIYATRISPDGTILDRTGIWVPVPAGNLANFHLLGAFWIGNAYTIVYSYQDFDSINAFFTAVARIDDHGVVIDPPRAVVSFFGRAADSNGSRIVIAGESAIAVLDDRAQLLEQTTLPVGPAYGVSIRSNGSTFLVSTFSYTGERNWLGFVSLDPEGHVVKSSQIGGVGTGDGPLIGTDHDGYLVMFQTITGSVAQDVGGDGTVGASAVIAGTAPSVSYGALLWTGDHFLLTGPTNDTKQDLSVASLDRDGHVVTSTAVIAPGTPGASNMPSIAMAAGKVFVAWTTGDQFGPDGLGVSGMFMNAAGGPLSEAFAVAVSSNAQRSPAIATGASRDIVAWIESTGIYAARLSADGSVSDGRGIKIAGAPIASLYLVGGGVAGEVRVLRDDDAYLIAWASVGRTLNAQLVDAETGTLIGLQVTLAPCVSSFDLGRDDVGDVAFVSDCSNVLYAQRFAATGPIGAPAQISPPQMGTSNPRAAWNGNEWLVAWNELIPIYSPAPTPSYQQNVRAQRVSSSFNAIGSNPLAIDSTQYVSGYPFVATNGSDFLVSWARAFSSPGIYARRINSDGTFADNAPSPGIAISSVPSVGLGAIWDGNRYAVEYSSVGNDGMNEVRLTHLVSDALVDSIAVSPATSDSREADLAVSSSGQVRTVYARTATEAVYGGVTRVFAAEVFSARQRPFRRR